MYTVLLVDDEEKILEVMKVRIGWQELGVDKLLTASDGQAALEYFEQQRIDLLVTDIRMPRMDGLELIEKVRSLYPDDAPGLDALIADATVRADTARQGQPGKITERSAQR